MMKLVPWLGAAALLACGQGATPSSTGAASQRQRVVVGRFQGSVDVAAGTMTIASAATAGGAVPRNAATIPEGGGADRVQLANAGTPAYDATACGGGTPGYGGLVDLASRFASDDLLNVVAVIDTVTTGHEPCHATAPSGFAHGHLAAGGHATRSWYFDASSSSSFTFSGHIEADVLAPGAPHVYAFEAAAGTERGGLWLLSAQARAVTEVDALGNVLHVSAQAPGVSAQALASDASRLYVADPDGSGLWYIALADARGGAQAWGQVAFGGGAPAALALRGTTLFVVVSNGASSAGYVRRFDVSDPAAAPVPFGADFPVGHDPLAVALDGAGGLWVTSDDGAVSRYDGAAVAGFDGSALPQTIAVGSHPIAIAQDAAGQTWVVNFGSGTVTVLDGAGAEVQTLAVPWGMALASDGASMWMTTADGADNPGHATPYGADRVAGAAVQVGAMPSRAAAGLGYVWILHYPSGLTRLSPTAP